MKVKAKARGFDGAAIREVGDVFDMPDTTNLDPKNDWFVPLKGKEKAAAEGAAAEGADGDDKLA